LRIIINYEIERLLSFGLQHNLLEAEDIVPVRNALLDLLCVAEPYNGTVSYEAETATEVLEQILDFASETGLISEDTITRRDTFSARVMGLLMPRGSEVVRDFYTRYNRNPEEATDAFYALSRASNYIQVDRVQKNTYWTGSSDFGPLEISINLAKPEKDPRDIAAAKHAPATAYPSCLLCKENAGFAGTHSHPARQNHRIIPIKLNEDAWYLQYSPYVYYNEHCIILDAMHRPMQITESTFRRLFDFVTQFPHYFIGSNADLPIVGGSILNHDHFQGGRHEFPMAKASAYQSYTHNQFPGVHISIVKWPMSVIRIAGTEKDSLIRLAMHIFKAWQTYSDPTVNIHAQTGETPHNTVTPIARVNKSGQFELDIVLRNNRTTETHPFGLFHPHENLHHIKKENIGLIEVMGLAILPARLQAEFNEIESILQTPFDPALLKNSPHILKHSDWIHALVSKYGTENTQPTAKQIIKEETAAIFAKVLTDAGVFKWDEQGMAHFNTCIQSFGFKIR